MTVGDLKKLLNTIEDSVDIIASFDAKGNILFPFKDLYCDTTEDVFRVRLIIDSQGKWFSNKHYYKGKRELFKHEAL